MPTNILRKRGTKISAKDAPSKPAGRQSGEVRRAEIKIGRHALVATLLDTVAADRIWAALPLFSSAETWGQVIHFELRIESGREPGATVLAETGTLYFWGDEHRVILAFGATPLSRDGEMRLPVPCNAWARTDAELTNLAKVTAGQKVSLVRA